MHRQLLPLHPQLLVSPPPRSLCRLQLSSLPSLNMRVHERTTHTHMHVSHSAPLPPSALSTSPACTRAFSTFARTQPGTHLHARERASTTHTHTCSSKSACSVLLLSSAFLSSASFCFLAAAAAADKASASLSFLSCSSFASRIFFSWRVGEQICVRVREREREDVAQRERGGGAGRQGETMCGLEKGSCLHHSFLLCVSPGLSFSRSRRCLMCSS